MATPTIIAADLAAPLALDATIAALADAAPAPVSPFDWSALTAATGCSRDMYFANFTALRTQFDIDAAAVLFARSCGYLGNAKTHTAAKHGAIVAGLVTVDRELVNSDDAQKARARVWGHAC